MSIVELKRIEPQANNVADTLRKIADDIEANTLGYPVTTAVLMVGHTEVVKTTEDIITHRDFWDTYTLGPRSDTFTTRGLVSQCLNAWTSREWCS